MLSLWESTAADNASIHRAFCTNQKKIVYSSIRLLLTFFVINGFLTHRRRRETKKNFITSLENLRKVRQNSSEVFISTVHIHTLSNYNKNKEFNSS